MDKSLHGVISRARSFTFFSKSQSYFNQFKLSNGTLRNSLLKLNSVIAVVALSAIPAAAQDAAADPKVTLSVGDKVDFSALEKVVWIKDDGPKGFEPGKVYILECWATWCPPCIAAIPHVNGLHKKYHDKGLRVLGMSVWDGDLAKTKKFVTKKGDGMAYPVAFTGEQSAFSKNWLDAAGAKAIPHAFVVRNGVLLGSTEVLRLTDDLIESLLSGDEGAQKASDLMSTAQDNQAKTEELAMAIGDAAHKKDPDTMMKLLKELTAIDPSYPDLPVLKLRVLIERGEWDPAAKALKSLPDSQAKNSLISSTGRNILRKKYAYSDAFKEVLVAQYKDYVLDEDSIKGPNHYGSLSEIQWDMGDKEAALATANKSIMAAKNSERLTEAFVIAYTRFAKTVKEGRMADSIERSKWVREAVKQIAEKKK